MILKKLRLLLARKSVCSTSFLMSHELQLASPGVCNSLIFQQTSGQAWNKSVLPQVQKTVEDPRGGTIRER
jgi:hypothetical protein